VDWYHSEYQNTLNWSGINLVALRVQGGTGTDRYRSVRERILLLSLSDTLNKTYKMTITNEMKTKIGDSLPQAIS